MRRRLLGAAVLALVLVSATAWGDGSGGQVLSRAAPWDAAKVEFSLKPVTPPPEPETQDSPLEAGIKARLAGDIQSLTAGASGPWSSPPIRDLLKTALAAIAHDERALADRGGLASAVVRAALVYALDAALTVAGLTRDERLSAIYEGLAMSAAFGGFPFPERTGSVPPAAVALARAAQRMLDATHLGSRVSLGSLGSLLTTLDAPGIAFARHTIPDSLSPDAKLALREATDPKSPETAEALAVSLPRLRRVLPEIRAGAPDLGEPFFAALDARARIDVDVLAKLSAEGLGGLDVKALALELKENVLPCGAPPAGCADRDFFVATLGHLRAGLGRDDLLGAVRLLAAHLGFSQGEHPAGGSFERELFLALESAVVVDGGRVKIDQAEVVKYLSGRYGVGERGLETGRLVGLPPSVILDVNAGVPAFADVIRLMGDATIGYRTPTWGVVGNGGVNYFDLQSTGILTDNLHAFGGLDGFYVTGNPEAKLRFNGRFSFGLDYFDTTTIEANTTRNATFRFGDYDSLLLRAIAKIGILWRPSERWSLEGTAGVGGQHESYDTTSLDASGVKFSSPETLSVRTLGSVIAKWRFWPRHLGARVRGGIDVFKLTRETLSFSSSSTGVSHAGLSATSETEVDLQGRFYVDVDYLKLAGFVPAAWFGTDYVSTPAAASLVPAAGIAFFNVNGY